MASTAESLVNPQSVEMDLTLNVQVWPLTVSPEHVTLVADVVVSVQPQSLPVTENKYWCPADH